MDPTLGADLIEDTYAGGVTSGTMKDTFGRSATDLRVSLTDRCNLRCTYCMPEDGPGWLGKSTLLTDAEVSRLVRLAIERLDVTDVRFTGGEPLLRPGLEAIITAASQLTPRPTLSLTTNGIGLAERAAGLRDAGLDRINISLDTLDASTFSTLARRDRLDDVLAGISAAKNAGLHPVKINTVLLRGINDHEAPKLLHHALDNGLQLRFIEQMPLDPMGAWSREAMVTADEILASLRTHWDLTAISRGESSQPADEWLINGGPQTVGIVASVTRPFCNNCDRVRLTADGQVRSCLFGRDDADLRTALRTGESDDVLEELWRGAVSRKAAGHGINRSDFSSPDRPMSAIGG